MNTTPDTSTSSLSPANGHPIDLGAERPLSQAAAAARDHARTAAHEIGDAASREAARVGEMVRQWVERQSDAARHAVGTVRDEATHLADRTQAYVRDEPVKSVLAAAAAGALLTALVVFATRRGSQPR
jgi:ElaB/YqjD/DUF883 family membrane-anchored ribosome-binding protein